MTSFLHWVLSLQSVAFRATPTRMVEMQTVQRARLLSALRKQPLHCHFCAYTRGTCGICHPSPPGMSFCQELQEPRAWGPNRRASSAASSAAELGLSPVRSYSSSWDGAGHGAGQPLQIDSFVSIPLPIFWVSPGAWCTQLRELCPRHRGQS